MTLIHHMDADLLGCTESSRICLPITQVQVENGIPISVGNRMKQDGLAVLSGITAGARLSVSVITSC